MNLSGQNPETMTGVTEKNSSGGAVYHLRHHWPEYLMEAAELGIFMLSACAFSVWLFHPHSYAATHLPNGFLRRLLAGLAMGATMVLLVYSPLGKQSGAHMNPAFSLAFFRLGKLPGWDLVFYTLAQFLGGAAGVWVALQLFGGKLADPAVRYAVTVPGENGRWVAFALEIFITFVVMTTVLYFSNHRTKAKYTGVAIACLVAMYVTFESPFSGMSMNPARTVASAIFANVWSDIWIYFVAPPIGMLAAVELFPYKRRRADCAKLHHDNDKRCIFCEHRQRQAQKAIA